MLELVFLLLHLKLRILELLRKHLGLQLILFDKTNHFLLFVFDRLLSYLLDPQLLQMLLVLKILILQNQDLALILVSFLCNLFNIVPQLVY